MVEDEHHNVHRAEFHNLSIDNDRSPSRTMDAITAAVQSVSDDLEDIESDSATDQGTVTLQITAQNRHSHRPEDSVSRVLEFTVDEHGAIKSDVNMAMVHDDDGQPHDHHFAGMTANPLSADRVREVIDILRCGLCESMYTLS